MEKTTCPVCKEEADLDPEQENTIYCKNPECGFMGILPQEPQDRGYDV